MNSAVVDEEYIIDFLDEQELDIRVTGNARFTDQKVKIDNLQFISDCILESNLINFTRKDIECLTYAKEKIELFYDKPKIANNEYDKLYGQPLKLLAYAGVLKEKRVKRQLEYSVLNKALLEYISRDHYRALKFLSIYYESVLRKSNFWPHIELYFKSIENKEYTQLDLTNLKDCFTNFLKKNTKIGSKGSDGIAETRRIFNPMLNILAFSRKLKGTTSGRVSDITLSDLMYNRPNWRDRDKNKSETRDEYKQRLAQSDKVEKVDHESYFNYLEAKNKKIIKQLYSGKSEIDMQDGATQVHHIFPKYLYPQFSYFLENLILLTPDQHFKKAHPNNKTSIVCEKYQVKCLKSKNKSINNSIASRQDIYDIHRFVYMITEGYNDEVNLKPDYKSIDNYLDHRFKELISA